MSTTWEQLAAEAATDASALPALADALLEAGAPAIQALLESLLPHPTHVYVVHYGSYVYSVFKSRELAKEYAQQTQRRNTRLDHVDVTCAPWQTMLNCSDGALCDRYWLEQQQMQHEAFE